MTFYDFTKQKPNWVAEYDISDAELERILSAVDTIEEFDLEWYNDDWWTDANN